MLSLLPFSPVPFYPSALVQVVLISLVHPKRVLEGSKGSQFTTGPLQEPVRDAPPLPAPEPQPLSPRQASPHHHRETQLQI